MSSRVAVILQPSYLPWLGYFAQLQRSDVFVVYDDVQYDKESWRNRNRIKTPAGPQWLTVPVLTSGRGWPSNRDIQIDNTSAWRTKHVRSIAQNYAKAPHYGDYMPEIAAVFEQPWRFLLDLNMACLNLVTDALGLRRTIRFASEIGVDGHRVDRLIGLCKALGADRFYEGAAGRDYIDERAFADAGITLEYQDYRHPVYAQRFGEFVPYLSIVDLLFNCGPKSLETLTQ